MPAILRVIDVLPFDSDGEGHWPGIEYSCCPDTLTDGKGGFFVYHGDFTEKIFDRG